MCRCRHPRGGVGRVCVVADRGMISAAAMAALEERGQDKYVLGVRDRTDTLVRRVVLEDAAPFTPLLVERRTGETQLFVKEIRSRIRDTPAVMARARSFALNILRKNGVTNVAQALWAGAINLNHILVYAAI